MSNSNYIGRFAPSPTGPLHFGSLVTAVASYFQARSNNGKWYLRIEDIDKERQQKDATNLILKTLEAHHLLWDSNIVYQSERTEYYNQAINKLHEINKLFYCQCSRKIIKKNNAKSEHPDSTVYPGTCRNLTLTKQQPHSLRLLVGEQIIKFTDKIQGTITNNLKQQGDFVIQKTDGSVTYQLAVAVDDALQNITEVVRGVDLIHSTSKQILIMKLLNYPSPNYCHIPVVCHPDGSKLSKQTAATAVDNSRATQQLWDALSYLDQNPPPELQNTTIQEIHDWAIQHWAISRISKKHNSLFYK